MPDFSLLDNQDQFGNQYYPADDRAVVITKEIWDEIIRTLLVAIQRDPSTAANNDIQPEIDTQALTLRAYAAGVADILRIYDKSGVLGAYFNQNAELVLGPNGSGRTLVIGGGGSLDAADAYILIGNGDTPTSFGWRLYYRGTTTGADGNEFGLQSTSDGAFKFLVDHDGNVNMPGFVTTGSLWTKGSLAHGVVTKSSNYTLAATETVALCNTASGAFTLTLPAAASCTDRLYRIKKKSVDINTLTIDANGSETIDGNLTVTLVTPYSSIDVVSDGSNWFIL